MTRADFDRALDETTPMFGVKEDELTRLYANGVISTGPEFDRVYGTVRKLLHQVAASDRTPLVSVIFTGACGPNFTEPARAPFAACGDAGPPTLTLRCVPPPHYTRIPSLCCLPAGPAGSGRTALAAKLGVESGFPFVKRISGESLVSHSETGKADAITRCFNDAYK